MMNQNDQNKRKQNSIDEDSEEIINTFRISTSITVTTLRLGLERNFFNLTKRIYNNINTFISEVGKR